MVTTNGSGIEKTWEEKRLNLLSETLSHNTSIQPYYIIGHEGEYSVRSRQMQNRWLCSRLVKTY